MLITRKELDFDFKGARFNLDDSSDRELLGWVLNQFLYGEVTGIQCGYWLYRAPSINAAIFLARQAEEELSHVKRILRIQSILGQKPAEPHRAIRFMATGMMGGTWGEHVAMEMAIGEGLVLSVFYALAQTIPDEKIGKILEFTLLDEERHVEFGEAETKAWLKRHPEDKSLLLSSALLQLLAMKRIKEVLMRKMQGAKREEWEVREHHPVLSQMDDFYDHVVWSFEQRIIRLGILDRPLSEVSFFQKAQILIKHPFLSLKAKWKGKFDQKLLTETYLQDEVVIRESQRVALEPVSREA
jgi:hypothetical protein